MKSYNKPGMILFSILAVIYLATLEFRTYPLSFLVKSIPIFTLMGLVFLNIPGSLGKRISLGLLFSGFGDICLALPFRMLFIFGILSFATAHCFYISVFLKNIKLRRIRMIVILALFLYIAALGVMLFPKLGAMLIPILIYMVVILIMAASSALGEANHPLILAGACLFIISDSIIVINGSLQNIRFASFLIMITYYSAQALIAYGSFKSFSQPGQN